MPTSPGFVFGQVPSASEWNADFATKADDLLLSTGSTTPRTLEDRFADVINLKDYGAFGDGVTDDTLAIQRAVTAARYKKLVVPFGRYVISSTITGLGPIIIEGMGHGGGPGEVSEPGTPSVQVSEFICKTTFTSGDMFYFPSEYAVSFRDIQLSSHVSLNFLNLTTRGSGAAIHLTGFNTTGNTNANSLIDNVSFSGFDVCVYLERCADTRITRSYFQAWKTAAIDINTGGFAVESSPGHIAFNKFFGDVTVGTAQQYAIRTSAGYGSIISNLIVGSQVAVQINANDLVNIGSIMIAHNSMEEQLTYGVNLVQTDPTTIDAVQIDYNEFSNLTNSLITAHVNITGATHASIKTVSITGNKIQSFLTGGSGVCISVQFGTTIMVSQNLFNITGCYAISVGSAVSVDILDNKINGSGILGTGGYLFTTPANVVFRDTSTRAITFANLPATADGSALYVSDGRPAPGTSAVSASGPGCVAWRTGGFWLTVPTTFASSGQAIRNPGVVGAVAGTPGTLPLNWTFNSLAGLAQQVVGTGTDADGLTYVDVRLFGTTSSTALTLRFDTTTGIPAFQGQSWTESVCVVLAAGTSTNITAFQTSMAERTTSGGNIASVSQNFTPGAISAALSSNRFNQTYMLPDATTAYILPSIGLTFSSGAAIDVTLRIAAPALYAEAALYPATKAPVSTTASAYTVALTDASILFVTTATHTLTLPAAASFPGRQLSLKNLAAFAINSASSNVVPLASVSAGTAILAATAGKWATLQSDGTNWQIMAGN